MSSTMTSSPIQEMAGSSSTAPDSIFNPVVKQVSPSGPVLLATEGFSASRSPALVARQLAERLRCPLRVVSVIEPVTVYADSMGLAPLPVMVDESYGSTREQSVREMLDAAWPAGTKYDLNTRFGAVSREIAAESRELAASVVVVGAAPHHRRKHVLSGVLATQVLRNVRCPVLSVAPGMNRLPRQVIVATDFSDASLRAAREALRLLDESGTLTLVHAIPEVNAERLALAGVMGREQAMRLLERMRAYLQRWATAGRVIELKVVEGNAEDSILALAALPETDLIAVGTHGPGVFERMFIGSTAASILHLAPCSVLAVQTPSAAERTEMDLEAWGSAETYDEHQWGKLLDEFTRRNIGRRVRVQVDDLAFGAQLQAAGYTLRGATFDKGDKRVDLMLGAPKEAEAHLTRTISRAISVAVSRDSSGRDLALQVRTETSETLVIFE